MFEQGQKRKRRVGGGRGGGFTKKLKRVFGV